MDSYYFVIGVTLVGFFVLAAVLLVPIYRFLKREEQTAASYTTETMPEPQSDSTADAANESSPPAGPLDA